MGHPLLRIQAEPVKLTELSSDKIQKIVSEMKACFTSKLTPVIGLAAPQLGYSKRLIAYQLLDEKLLADNNLEAVPLTFLVNPSMTMGTKTAIQYEFCESIPSYSGLVRRCETIKVKAFDLDGKVVERSYSGILARVIQHEIDHLNGVSFVQKMEGSSFRHDKYIDKYEMHVKA